MNNFGSGMSDRVTRHLEKMFEKEFTEPFDLARQLRRQPEVLSGQIQFDVDSDEKAKSK